MCLVKVNVPGEGYSRNMSCALNSISTVFFQNVNSTSLYLFGGSDDVHAHGVFPERQHS